MSVESQNGQGSPLLVFVGVASLDTIAVVGKYPARDERVVAEDIRVAGGGPAATAAVAAARLGHRTAIIAAIGDDNEGQQIREGLVAEGVNVAGLHTREGSSSSTSLVIVDERAKTRAIINRPGPQLPSQLSAEAQELLAAADWLHLDQHSWPSHELLTKAAPQAKVSLDGGNRIEGLQLDGIDLYAPTREALYELFDAQQSQHELGDIMQRARHEGAATVVVTEGGSGATLLSRNGVVSAQTPKAPIVSTLGAGDVFHGALLAAFAHSNESVETSSSEQAAILFATTVATLSCAGIDGRSRIPYENEVQHLLNASQQESENAL